MYIKNGALRGIGECGLFRGLSCDDRPDYEDKLRWLCDNINRNSEELLAALIEFPSIQFGLEQALKSLDSVNMFELFPSDFTHGKAQIPINGLIWMGDEAFMTEQIALKLAEGFSTLKMKIGAIDFNTELKILERIREQFTASELELRVDANGAFSVDEAMARLESLAEFGIHSIEQPIKAGQLEAMRELCETSPIAIALDEELIGVLRASDKRDVLDAIKPQYIILKPSLVGGFRGCKEWISLCETLNIGWWVTSALESNIGLSAIAQFTYQLDSDMLQGLGTGGLFTNNIVSPLYVRQGSLRYDTEQKWGNFNSLLKN